MLPMTMVFRFADPKLLDAPKSGDRVPLSAEMFGSLYTVTTVELAK